MNRRAALACLVTVTLTAACSGGHPGPTAASHAPSAQPSSGASGPTHTPSSAPTTTPTAGVANPGGLSDTQMVGQLFMTYVYGAGAEQATPAQRAANMNLYGEPTGAAVIHRWHLGGIILIDHNNLDPQRSDLSTDNVDSAAQTTRLTTGLQDAAAAAGDPVLLIATDQEGGQVQRIQHGVAPRPSQLALAHLTPAALTCSYYTLGRQLRALGVNQDFAPDADVVRTSGGVIGDRSFGPDPALDATDVTAAVTGLQRARVLATLKHWPGHGSTATDSHQALAVIHEDAPTWRRVDRVPFARAGRSAAAIMVGHLALPSLDPTGRPATFSPVLTGHLLRRDLGYQGVIVTDSLWMQPARAQGTPGQVALRALAAGNDLQLEPPDLPRSFTAVLHAIRHNPRIRQRVRGAAARILAAKAQLQRPAGSKPPC